MLAGLAGRRPHLVTALGEDRDGGRSTPPDAPVTSTGPSPGRSPRSSSAATLIAAVKPAVPMAIASRVVRPSGIGTTQPEGIRANVPKPPCRAVPIS